MPSFVENLLVADPCIDQAVVCGEGHNFLTALIVPHWDNLRQALQRTEEPEALVHCPQVCAFVQKRMSAALADVAPWEQVKKFVLLPRPFSVAADELTVSLKLRRQVVYQKYASQLDALYRE